MRDDQYPIYIVLGTRAQFVKVAPLMRMLLDQGLAYTLIYTAQHSETISEILKIYDLPDPDIVLYQAQEANTKGSFVRWFAAILFQVLFHPKRIIKKTGIVLTHGDTVTTWLAALLGQRSSCVVGHIESGYRSGNLLSPFPEELNRLFTFRLSDVYFCGDLLAIRNLEKYKGTKINLGANTMLDGVRFALDNPQSRHFGFQNAPYVLISIHRYENIFTTRFVDVIIPLLLEIANSHHLVMTLHPATRERLHSLDLYAKLDEHENITLHERFNFLDWISICREAKFVITDGGSNQEELSYLGVPTLLFRNETERQEGLGHNVVISKFERSVIADFIENLDRYQKPMAKFVVSPSQRIVDFILGESTNTSSE